MSSGRSAILRPSSVWTNQPFCLRASTTALSVNEFNEGDSSQTILGRRHDLDVPHRKRNPLRRDYITFSEYTVVVRVACVLVWPTAAARAHGRDALSGSPWPIRGRSYSTVLRLPAYPQPLPSATGSNNPGGSGFIGQPFNPFQTLEFKTIRAYWSE